MIKQVTEIMTLDEAIDYYSSMTKNSPEYLPFERQIYGWLQELKQDREIIDTISRYSSQDVSSQDLSSQDLFQDLSFKDVLSQNVLQNNFKQQQQRDQKRSISKTKQKDINVNITSTVRQYHINKTSNLSTLNK